MPISFSTFGWRRAARAPTRMLCKGLVDSGVVAAHFFHPERCEIMFETGVWPGSGCSLSSLRLVRFACLGARGFLLSEIFRWEVVGKLFEEALLSLCDSNLLLLFPTLGVMLAYFFSTFLSNRVSTALVNWQIADCPGYMVWRVLGLPTLSHAWLTW